MTQADAAAKAVLKLAETHYAASKDPLFLSTVGQTLRAQALWPIEGEKRTLKEWLQTLQPAIEVIQDPLSPARVAIATPASAEVVAATIDDRRHSDLLGRLARPVLLAFCVRADAGALVYLSKQPPFRYTLVEPTDPNAYHVIEPEYRVPGLQVRAVARMDGSDVAKLAAGISSWAEAHGIDLRTLEKAPREPVQDALRAPTGEANTALSRLYAAQNPGLVNQLVVPLDIALLLSRHG